MRHGKGKKTVADLETAGTGLCKQKSGSSVTKYLTDRIVIVALLQVRCLPAIAFLDPNDVAAGFQAVVDTLPDECLDLAQYFEETYLGRDVAGRWRAPLFAPDQWSQFRRTLEGVARTTNNVEGWHRRFSGRIGCSHPNVFTFLRSIRSEEDHWRTEVEKLVAGAEGARRRTQWQLLSDRLLRLAERRRDGEIGIADYVRGVAHNFNF